MESIKNRAANVAVDKRRVLVLGCGKMGRAILRGALDAGVVDRRQIAATTKGEGPVAALRRELEIEPSPSNIAACREADVVLVALKPDKMAEVLDCEPMRSALRGKLVISIAAGVRLDTIRQWLPQSAVVRAMPNTPCAIGRGTTALCAAEGVSESDRAFASALFAAIGRVILIDDEERMDVVTALSGSGPAFVYLMIEAVADGAVMMGLPRETALEVAASAFEGASAMVLKTDLHPAQLRDQVTTPAGCTAAGLQALEDGRLRSVLARTIERTTLVAGSMSRRVPATPSDDVLAAE